MSRRRFMGKCWKFRQEQRPKFLADTADTQDSGGIEEDNQSNVY